MIGAMKYGRKKQTMLEKIRVAVDRETESILDRITQGIEDRLTERPEWSNEFATDLRDNVRQLLLAKPDWVAALQESLLSKENKRAEQINKELQEVKSVGIGLGTQLEQSQQAVVDLASAIKKAQNGIDQIKNAGRDYSDATATLINELSTNMLSSVSDQRLYFDQLFSAKPDWAVKLEAAILVSDKDAAAKIDNILQEVKAAGRVLREQHEQSKHAVTALTSEIQNVKQCIDKVKSDSRESAEETNTLIRAVSSAIAAVQDNAHCETKQMGVVLDEQQQLMSQMSSALMEQSAQMEDLQIRMKQIASPWWEKIFGGKK